MSVAEMNTTYLLQNEFNRLLANIEPRGLAQVPLHEYVNRVRLFLEPYLPVLDVTVVGSFSMQTMIAPVAEADINMLVVLDHAMYTPANYRGVGDLMRQCLTGLSRETPYRDGTGCGIVVKMDSYRLNIIPMCIREDGVCVVPDAARKGWIETDPRLHREWMSRENQKHAGALCPLVKIVKSWNGSVKYAFEPFYLQVLVTQMFSGIMIESYAEALAYFFRKGRSDITRAVNDPTSPGNYIFGLRSVRMMKDAVALFKEAEKRSSNAMTLMEAGYSIRAAHEWGKLFGRYFPSNLIPS